MSKISGSCRCGETKFEVDDAPIFAVLCHCARCRRSNASPFSWVIGQQKASFKVTTNEDKLITFVHTEKLSVISCGLCGGPIANLPQGFPVVGTFPSTYEQYKSSTPAPIAQQHKPVMHLWYSERILDVEDKLPKFLGFPKEMGGSGELYTPPQSS